MGKGSVGKSYTINSIVGERVPITDSAFQSETPTPVIISRTHSGFTLNVIDTPGLVEGGYVSDQVLETIKRKLLKLMMKRAREVHNWARLRLHDILNERALLIAYLF